MSLKEIIGVNETTSQPFEIEPGKQITIFAVGLGEGEYVEILLASITPGGPRGSLCCPGPVELPGLGQLYPLNRVCCDCVATPVQLTRENPWYVLREPQGVPLIAHVVAGVDAVVTVSTAETINNGSCEQAPCPDCPEVSIAVTSFTQTTATVSITGGPATVTLNGVQQYGVGPFTFGNLEPGTQYVASVVSDCGSKATVALTTEPPPVCPEVTVTVTATTQTSISVSLTGGPATVKVGADEQYGNGPFTFAGLTPAKFYTVMAISDCGNRASTTAETLPSGDFCASTPSPWPSRGFLYHPNDIRDPAATVNVLIDGVSQGFGYPNPGPGHTSAVLDTEGAVLAYAANTSDCAPPCPCEPVDLCALIAKCPQPSVQFSNVGDAFGGGICYGATAIETATPGMIVFQGRDRTWIEGDANMTVWQPGVGPSSLQATITNDFEVPSLLVAELIGHPNQMYDTCDMGFAFRISEDINEPWPMYSAVGGAPIDPKNAYTLVSGRIPTSDMATGHDQGHNETAGPAKFVKIMLPGETITLHGQWWASTVIGDLPGQLSPGDSIGLHGAMYFTYILYRGGINVSA